MKVRQPGLGAAATTATARTYILVRLGECQRQAFLVVMTAIDYSRHEGTVLSQQQDRSNKIGNSISAKILTNTAAVYNLGSQSVEEAVSLQ